MDIGFFGMLILPPDAFRPLETMEEDPEQQAERRSRDATTGPTSALELKWVHACRNNAWAIDHHG